MRAVLGQMSLCLGCPFIPREPFMGLPICKTCLQTYAHLTFLHDQYLEVKREMLQLFLQLQARVLTRVFANN
jgi:hypothetical protein